VPENSDEQVDADVTPVRVGHGNSACASHKELVPSFRNRFAEAQPPHAPDELIARDRPDTGHLSYLAGANLQAVDRRDVVMQGDPEEHPAFQRFRELVATLFQRGSSRVDAIQARNLAVELANVDEFVVGMVHRGGEVFA
jgi:hypothetical protein